MSVILAVKDLDKIHVAADCAVVEGTQVYLDTKLWHPRPDLLFGGVGAFSLMCDLRSVGEGIVAAFDPEMPLKEYVHDVVYANLCDHMDGCQLLVATPQDFVILDSDGSCTTDRRAYCAIGDGAPIAMGFIAGALSMMSDNSLPLHVITENAIFETCMNTTTCSDPVELITVGK